MTDTPTRPRTDVSTDSNADAPTESEADERPTTGSVPGGDLEPNAAAIRRYLAWGGLAVCSLLAVFALIQFYGSVTESIELWVDPKYQPLMGAAFNLAVLLLSLIGVSALVRELN